MTGVQTCALPICFPVTISRLVKDSRVENSVKENSKYTSIFDLVYNKYPKKQGKKQALRHFQASVNTDQDCANIQKALEN